MPTLALYSVKAVNKIKKVFLQEEDFCMHNTLVILLILQISS
jgi:hypothetical protein